MVTHIIHTVIFATIPKLSVANMCKSAAAKIDTLYCVTYKRQRAGADLFYSIK